MNIAQHLAATLKHLRQQRGWSLSRLAEETGVSKAMLGQIERNESSPTVATLWKIATGLNVPFSGEGRRFAGDATHAYRNRGAQAAHFHSLIHYPKEKTASEPAARQDD